MAFAGGAESATAGIPAGGVEARASAISAGIGIGAATCIVARCVGVLLMRIFIPLSDEISMESTDDSSSISTSFFTYRRSIMLRVARVAGGVRRSTQPWRRGPSQGPPSSIRSRAKVVSTFGPSGASSTSSSIRTPPHPGR